MLNANLATVITPQAEVNTPANTVRVERLASQTAGTPAPQSDRPPVVAYVAGVLVAVAIPAMMAVNLVIWLI